MRVFIRVLPSLIDMLVTDAGNRLPMPAKTELLTDGSAFRVGNVMSNRPFRPGHYLWFQRL